MTTILSFEPRQAANHTVGTPKSPPPDGVDDQIQRAIMETQQATNHADAALGALNGGRAHRATAGPNIVITQNGRVVPPVPPLPGFTISSGPNGDGDIPPQVVEMAWGFFAMCAVMVVGWPIARAFGRRIERNAPVPALPPAASDQLQRIEQAVEAMSIEVERISESQRFMAKIQSGSTAQRV